MTDKIDTSAGLVERLRDHGQHEREEMNHTWRRFRKERLEAADAIDALRAEVERLREAKTVSFQTCECGMAGPCMWSQCKSPILNAALKGGDA